MKQQILTQEFFNFFQRYISFISLIFMYSSTVKTCFSYKCIYTARGYTRCCFSEANYILLIIFRGVLLLKIFLTHFIVYYIFRCLYLINYSVTDFCLDRLAYYFINYWMYFNNITKNFSNA